MSKSSETAPPVFEQSGNQSSTTESYSLRPGNDCFQSEQSLEQTVVSHSTTSSCTHSTTISEAQSCDTISDTSSSAGTTGQHEEPTSSEYQSSCTIDKTKCEIVNSKRRSDESRPEVKKKKPREFLFL